QGPVLEHRAVMDVPAQRLGPLRERDPRRHHRVDRAVVDLLLLVVAPTPEAAVLEDGAGGGGLRREHRLRTDAGGFAAGEAGRVAGAAGILEVGLGLAAVAGVAVAVEPTLHAFDDAAGAGVAA